MSPVLELDREVDFQIPIKIHIEKSAHKGSFFFRGLASTDDIDLVADIITEDALAAAKDDLLKNPTIFLDHEPDERIGTVVETEFVRGKGLIVTGRILDARPDIKEEVQNGSLSKLSISATVLNGRRKTDEITGAKIIEITRIRFKHVALVGNPANQEARTLEFWTEKSLKDHKKKIKNKKGVRKMEIIKDAALGRKVRRLREARGWTRDELGRRIGITGSTVGQIERGEIEAPPDSRLSRIARAFGISVSNLVSGTGLMKFMKNVKKGGNMTETSAETKVEEKNVETEETKETTVTETEESTTEKVDAGDLQKDLKDIEDETSRQKAQFTATAQMKFLMNRLKADGNEATKSIVAEMESVFGQFASDDTQKSETDIKLDKLIGVVSKLASGKSDTEETETNKTDENGKEIEKSEPRKVIRKGEAERGNVSGEVKKALDSIDEKKLDAMTPADALNQLVKAGLL